MKIQSPHQIVKKYGIRPNKKLGQNFITDIDVLEKIANVLNVCNDDFVVEFGSGPGSLSAIIFNKNNQVLGLEFDKKLLEIAKKEFPEIQFVNADIREWTPLEFKKQNLKLIGNLPYYLTSFFIRRFLDWNYKIAVFMIQKEVGEKILAKPKSSEYGLLSVIVQAKAHIEKLFNVDRNCFFPVPEVDSVVLIFKPKNIGWSDDAEKIAEVCFTHRRQTMLKSLRRKFGLEKAKFALEKVGINPKTRPQEISPEEFVCLSEALAKI